MLKHLTLVGAAMLVTSATAASAQVRNCTACETAIKDKLAELDDRTSKTNLLVKTVDRKLDPLAVKVDTLDNKLTVLEEKIDAVGVQLLQISNGGSGKGAVVIDYGFTLSNLPNNSTSVTNFCQSINYKFGRSLTTNPNYPSTVAMLVCYM